MKRQIKQFRYYGPNSPQNSPDTNHQNLLSGDLFIPFTPIIQLGVQGLPGTELYLNNSKDPVIIGSTGIYELDIQGMAEITSLSFDNETLNLIDQAKPVGQNFLLIDIIYEEGGSK